MPKEPTPSVERDNTPNIAQEIYYDLLEVYGDQVKLGVADRALLQRYCSDNKVELLRVADTRDDFKRLVIQGFLHQYFPEVELQTWNESVSDTTHESETAIVALDSLIEKHGIEVVARAVFELGRTMNALGQHSALQGVSALTMFFETVDDYSFQDALEDIGGVDNLVRSVRIILTKTQPLISVLELKTAIAALLPKK